MKTKLVNKKFITEKLKPLVDGARRLNEELEAELKVLSELVKHHAKEEESEMLPGGFSKKVERFVESMKSAA